MSELLRRFIPQALLPTAHTAVVVAAATAAGLLLHLILFGVLRRLSPSTRTSVDDALVKHCRGPSRLLLPLVAMIFAAPLLDTDAATLRVVQHATSLGLIAATSWLLWRLIQVVHDVLLERYDLDAEDNLASRKVHTQMRVFRRIAFVLIVIIGGAAALMTFDRIRQLGASILASAGIVGLVVGFAAQRTLANLVAGVQLALTQPIRIDDVVIVEGEWGWIEEITLTYVVVRIWDLRRLIVPVSHFIEKPFQSWTRVTAELLGTVYLHLDYRAPIEALRAELERICASSELWDGKVCGVQVTGSSERTIEVRALVSAANSSAAWDLRCEVREKLLAFLQRDHPEVLPRIRAEIDGAFAG